MDLSSQAAGIGALADDTRRALYEYVCGRPEPVSREQAATALGFAQHNATFHLDRLVAEGLLEAGYRRLNGRAGPGAGRPSKLYRRSEREFAVSLPPRRYDLVGNILATAVTRAEGGEPLSEAVSASAYAQGLAVSQAAAGAASTAASPPSAPSGSLDALATVLTGQGFEASVDDGTVVLANCPFHALAQRHTALVCGLNRAYVQGMADGLGSGDIEACLEPEPGSCCVRARERL